MPEGPVGFALRYTPIAATVGAAPVALMLGYNETLGFLIGAALSILSLLVASIFVGKTVHSKTTRLSAMAKLQSLLIIKLPIFALIVFFVNSLGRRPLACFLVGYLLVYLGLLLGAIFNRSAPATCDKGP